MFQRAFWLQTVPTSERVAATLQELDAITLDWYVSVVHDCGGYQPPALQQGRRRSLSVQTICKWPRRCGASWVEPPVQSPCGDHGAQTNQYRLGYFISIGMRQKLPKIIASALVKRINKFLLVKEVLEDGKEHWIIPGGSVEFGESLTVAAIRESKEEVGLRVKITKFLSFKEALYPHRDYHTIIFCFLAKVQRGRLKVRESKILEAKFFSPHELQNLPLVHSARWLLKEVKIL